MLDSLIDWFKGLFKGVADKASERMTSHLLSSFILTFAVLGWEFWYILILPGDATPSNVIDEAKTKLTPELFKYCFLSAALYTFVWPWISGIVIDGYLTWQSSVAKSFHEWIRDETETLTAKDWKKHRDYLAMDARIAQATEFRDSLLNAIILEVPAGAGGTRRLLGRGGQSELEGRFAAIPVGSMKDGIHDVSAIDWAVVSELNIVYVERCVRLKSGGNMMLCVPNDEMARWPTGYNTTVLAADKDGRLVEAANAVGGIRGVLLQKDAKNPGWAKVTITAALPFDPHAPT